MAAREAFEEGGLVGKIVVSDQSDSTITAKRLLENQERLYRVEVFLLSVDQQHEGWPEKEQRECQWVTP